VLLLLLSGLTNEFLLATPLLMYMDATQSILSLSSPQHHYKIQQPTCLVEKYWHFS
jgi:hypothetical protein